MTSEFEFSHTNIALTRFPPNIEQIRVERESTTTWLIARRNDIELKFPLSDEDRQHLIGLLS